MRYKQFNILVYALAVGIAAAAAAFNSAVDPYGLFHSHRGRTCVVYHNERMSKYLFAHRYIPENFNGLLIGSSISANWDTARLSGYSVYNASLSGGNISEGKLIADKVFQRKPPRLLLMVIHPYMTETFGRKTGNMIESEYWGALGSHQLLLTYGSALKIRLGWTRQRFNAYGRDDFDPPRRQPGAPTGTGDFAVDERALAEYADLLERARLSGAKIVGIVPPFEVTVWQSRQQAFQAYLSQISPLFRVNESIIDFNGPEYRSLCSSPANFSDGAHLSSSAAAVLVSRLEARLRLLSERP